MPPPRVATYRVQLTPGFGFDAVAEIVGDLARLGISHLYLSPVAEAVPGSLHGYDVVDPGEVRAELGGEEGLRSLAETVADHGMGLVLDLVPNHVSTADARRNPWWWEVLRDGPGAEAAAYFDIDWDHADQKVLVPILGAPLHDVVVAGDLVLDGDTIRYHGHSLPLDTTAAGDDQRDDLRDVLERQHFRLQHWRHPDRNVRRFFTIDDLVAIRPEVPAVADAVHRIAATLRGDGLLDGVRVDHVDGLADPSGYLDTLHAALGDGCWVLVEKILAVDEPFPAGWNADGTTGYEWITRIDHLFTHPRGEDVFTRSWHAATDDTRGYGDLEDDGVRHVLLTSLRPDLDRVARTAASVLRHRSGEPVVVDDLVDPLVELTVALGRYRTYLPGGTAVARAPEDPDVALIRRAARRAAQRLDSGPRAWLDHIVAALLDGGELARRWQQLTGPARAKGGEDRALYRYLRLIAHNEVGGDPDRWSAPLDDFHRHNTATAATTPSTLLAGTTHDTKRSEDVRARLLALTERPDRWESFVRDCGAVLARHGGDAPSDPISVHLALQTAVGAWPIDGRRLGDHLVKAAREADVATSWTDPDPDHETSLHVLAALVTEGDLAVPVATLVGEIDGAARAVSMAQLVLRTTAPGVPDFYQGSESWLRVLVDPDNRRGLDPVTLRARVDAATAAVSVWESSDPKTALVQRVLSTRRDHHGCFGAGSGYEPHWADGRHGDHVVAFARSTADGDRIVTVASRFPGSRPGGWGDTTITLPAGSWTDVLAPGVADVEGRCPLGRLLGDRPAALLVTSRAG